MLHQSQPVRSRIWELDFLRGVAIVLMVLFHLIYDLNEFYDIPIAYDKGIIYYTGKVAASLFIFIAGISCSLSRSNVKRGLLLLVLAFLITITTWIAVPGSNIIFGILHFLGVSVLFYPLFQNIKPYGLIFLGTMIIVTGQYLSEITARNNFLMPVGLTAENFYSADYYPLFPWFGLFLYGVAFGKLKYRSKKSLFSIDLSRSFLVLLGRHSLSIYLVHQPIILLILYVFSKSL